jgi:enoyl-CoA hydratase/3-hydroxyacyl-CoA dehydrogenase
MLGAGTMGRGIATVAALAGYGIALRDVSEALVEEGYDCVGAALDRLVDSDRLDAEAAAAARDRMTPVVDLDAAVGDADLVVEALPERMDLKRDVYAETCSRLPDDALLVTNTSSLSITDLGAATDRSARFCGMHFFNPPVKMDLVEVIAEAETADETLAAVESVAREMDKTPVRVRNDSPGFVVNRVLLPTLNEAAWLVNDGVASVETVDATATAGLDLPTGAFELADYVGIDVVVDVVLRVRRRRADPRRRSGPTVRRRLLAVAANETAHLVGGAVADAADVDTALRLGANFPTGPAAMADAFGVDRLRGRGGCVRPPRGERGRRPGDRGVPVRRRAGVRGPVAPRHGTRRALGDAADGRPCASRSATARST